MWLVIQNGMPGNLNILISLLPALSAWTAIDRKILPSKSLPQPVVDLRGAFLVRPPYGPKFSQFHAVFRKICLKIICWHPRWRVGAPSYRNPGSTPANPSISVQWILVKWILAESWLHHTSKLWWIVNSITPQPSDWWRIQDFSDGRRRWFVDDFSRRSAMADPNVASPGPISSIFMRFPTNIIPNNIFATV